MKPGPLAEIHAAGNLSALDDRQLLAKSRHDPAAAAAMWQRWEAEAARPARKPALSQAFARRSPFAFSRRVLDEAQRAAAHARRRSRGGDGRLPDRIRSSFSEGQRAALSVVAQEVLEHGQCSRPIDAIAAIAGVCRRTVQGALRRAAALGFLLIRERPQRGARHLPHIVRIVAADWLSWLRPKRRSSGDIGCKGVHTMKNKALERGQAAPPHPLCAVQKPPRHPPIGDDPPPEVRQLRGLSDGLR